MARVSIVKGTNPQGMTVEALEMVEALDVVSDDRPVLIKPNYINARHPSTGITTDGRVMEGVVIYLKQSGVDEIIIGEGCGLSDTFRAFNVAGVDDVANRWNVDLIDLNRDEFVEVNPPKPLALNRVKVAKTALESTIVSVPKLKLHGSAGVTLSIKNMMGVMTPKGSMHRGRLSKNIADLASIVKPSLAVVDGIIAGEGHETSGNPVEMNLIISGKDPVAVDAVGAAVMGVPPESVKHLRYAEQKGLGTCDLRQIEVVGEPIEKVKRKFRRSLTSRIQSLLRARRAEACPPRLHSHGNTAPQSRARELVRLTGAIHPSRALLPQVMRKKLLKAHRYERRGKLLSLSSFEENLWIARIAEFENPRKMIFGVDCVERVGVEAKQLGAGKVIVVSDETIEKIGLLEKVSAPLRGEGLEVEAYKIPVMEPDMASARAITDAIRKSKYDVVVGVGGGSCLDSAKTAAAMATNPGDVSEYCARVKGPVRELKQRTLPKILIPTTSGTGSEASNTLVIIDEGYKTWITDNRLLAEVAMVDPTLTLTMPPGLTAGTGMDALSHVTEALMSRRTNPLSDAMAFEAVRLVFNNLRTAYFSGENLEARWNMSMAATLGGWVIGFPWIGGPANLGHCIAEAMGSKYRIPHGVACALALPYTMEFNLPACTERLAEIASVVCEDVDGLSTYDMALQSVDAVLGLMEDIELPTSLSQVNFPEEDIPDFARYIVEERQYLYDLEHYNPRKLTLENTTQLLERMWEEETAR